MYCGGQVREKETRGRMSIFVQVTWTDGRGDNKTLVYNGNTYRCIG